MADGYRVAGSKGDDALEQAWRNGFGSALNAICAADSLVSRQHVPEKHEGNNKIIRQLITRWVRLIESLTDEFVNSARDVGFASTAHLDGAVSGNEEETG